MHRAVTRIPDLVLLEPTVHGDERGFFVESWRALDLEGFQPRQANQSRSRRGIVRGMHFQVGEGIGKLVRCARGEILDVAVDVRPGSPTFGEWEGHVLDDVAHRALFVPVGFAHGFCVLSEEADLVYLQDGLYDPAAERGVHFADPDVGIAWPEDLELVPSPRDAAAPRLAEIAGELHFDR